MTTNLRLAVRTLLKTPVVTAVAIVSLGLGIGSNAAIFSLFNQILLRPLPVAEPERLVNLEAPGPKPGSDSCNAAGGCDEVFSYPMFRDLQGDQTVLTDLVAHRYFFANVAHDGRTLSGAAMAVSGSYFPTLGLLPAAGRLFGPEIDEPIGGHPVAVLAHDFWQNELDANPDIIGDALVVNGHPLTVVGVAPEGFRGTTLARRPLIFVPVTLGDAVSLAEAERYEDRRSYWLYVFGRLQPGISMTQARARLEPQYRNILADVEAPLQENMSEATMARFLDKALPMSDGRRGQSDLDESGRTPLLLLLGVTAMVVLIACANIANLLLARSAARAPDVAVRLALGGSRRHLLAQLLTESCVLALVGGVVGLAVAQWTLRLIGTFLPPQAIETIELSIDPTVVLFTLALSLATGLAFGIFPALHSTRADLITVLKDQAGQPSGARSASRFRGGLVVAQLALSMTLLIVAGLFIESLRNVTRVDLGLETDNVVTFWVFPTLSGYDDVRARALYERIETELAAQPGVRDVGAASVAVLAGNSWGTSVMVEGFDAGPDTDRGSRFNRVGPGYLDTLGVPVLAGRDFTTSDSRRDSPGRHRQRSLRREVRSRTRCDRQAVGARGSRRGPRHGDRRARPQHEVQRRQEPRATAALPPLPAGGGGSEPDLLRTHEHSARGPAPRRPGHDEPSRPQRAHQRSQDAPAAGA